MKFRCPSCGMGVFNTRLDACEFCGAALPEELRMSEETKEKIARDLERKAKEEREARRERYRQRGGSHGCGGHGCGGFGGCGGV